MQIVRDLAREGNPIAKIAFLTRLAESTVREILAPFARPSQQEHAREGRAARLEALFGGEPIDGWGSRKIAA